MRKRKERTQQCSETLTSNNSKEEEREKDKEVAGEDEAKGGFFSCYLLCSMCPRFKGQTYIGFTVNPRRRIRQHNGELKSGAWRTKSKRPWEMILCIYGFPTNVIALQFEWAWQHPTVSLAVRKEAASMKSRGGIANKIKLAYTMLTLSPWQSLKLTVNFFSTKYMEDAIGCKSLPKQMKVQYSPMDELPCYTGFPQTSDEMDGQYDEDEDVEKGSNLRHSECQIRESVYSTSDCHHSSIEELHDILNENDAMQNPGEPFIPKVDVGGSQPREDFISRDHEHRITPLITSLETIEGRDPHGLVGLNSNEFGLPDELQVSTPIAVKSHQLSSTDGLVRCSEFSCKLIDLSSPSEVDSRVQSPFSSNFCSVNRFQDKDPTGLIQGNVDLEEELSPKQGQEALSLANNNPPACMESLLPSRKVEVIDLSSPSSNDIIRYFRQKKRRNNWVSQDVIDLTKSPNSVPL